MLVKAISQGYYGKKIRVAGEEFALTNKKDFSKNWMVKLNPEANADKPKDEPDGGDSKDGAPKGDTSPLTTDGSTSEPSKDGEEGAKEEPKKAAPSKPEANADKPTLTVPKQVK